MATDFRLPVQWGIRRRIPKQKVICSFCGWKGKRVPLGTHDVRWKRCPRCDGRVVVNE